MGVTPLVTRRRFFLTFTLFNFVAIRPPVGSTLDQLRRGVVIDAWHPTAASGIGAHVTHNELVGVCDVLELFGRILALGNVDCDGVVFVPDVFHDNSFVKVVVLLPL